MSLVSEVRAAAMFLLVANIGNAHTLSGRYRVLSKRNENRSVRVGFKAHPCDSYLRVENVGWFKIYHGGETCRHGTKCTVTRLLSLFSKSL